MTDSEFLKQCAEVAAPICGSPIDFDLDFLGDYAEKIGVALWERHVRQWIEKRNFYLQHDTAGYWFERNPEGVGQCYQDYCAALLAAVQAAKEKP